MSWNDTVHCLTNCLNGLIVSDLKGSSMRIDAGFALLCARTESLRDTAGTIFLVGNGASAAMASHVAADLAKNGQVHTEVFSDLALITAVANDISYDQVFAEPLRRRMKPGDMLAAISSSGNSPNVINAAIRARELGGQVVTLTAMRPDNVLRSMGDINFYLPGETYGMAESGHAAVLHHWIDMIIAGCAA